MLATLRFMLRVTLPFLFVLFPLLSEAHYLLLCSKVQQWGAYSSLAIDERYGQANQYDQVFLKENLITESKSMLCGPTCLYNVLEKIRIVEGTKTIPNSDAFEVVSLVKNIFPSLGLSIDTLKERGIKANLLGEGLNLALVNNNLSAQVEVLGPLANKLKQKGGLSTENLKTSISKDTSVIVLISRYSVQNAEDASDANRRSGHFLIVSGYDPSNPKRIFFNDPLRPKLLRSAILQPVTTSEFGTPTLQVFFEDDYEKQPTILITRTIFVTRNHQMP